MVDLGRFHLKRTNKKKTQSFKRIGNFTEQQQNQHNPDTQWGDGRVRCVPSASLSPVLSSAPTAGPPPHLTWPRGPPCRRLSPAKHPLHHGVILLSCTLVITLPFLNTSTDFHEKVQTAQRCSKLCIFRPLPVPALGPPGPALRVHHASLTRDHTPFSPLFATSSRFPARSALLTLELQTAQTLRPTPLIYFCLHQYSHGLRYIYIYI